MKRDLILSASKLQDSAAHADIHFLEEQLAALIEMRGDGHFSDIIGFARNGSHKAALLSHRATGESDRLHRLAGRYRELVTSLVH